MLYEISKDLDVALKTRGVPMRVVYGPEPTTAASATHERIVLQHDFDKGDTFNRPTSTSRNPSRRYTRTVGGVLRVYARSPKTGAAKQDHIRRANDVVPRILAAMDQVVNTRKQQWAPVAGGLELPDDLEGSSVWPCAVYRLDFTVDRGEFDTTWDGDAKPEATLDGFNESLVVHVNGGDEETIPFGN